MKLEIAAIGFGVATAMFLAASEASAAEEPEPLFKKGRLVLDVLGADVPVGNNNGAFVGYAGPLTLQSEHFEGGSSANRQTQTSSAYGVAPSLDYFITDHITLGGRLGIAYEESHQYNTSGVGTAHTYSRGFSADIGPRVGLAVPIISSLGFWPRVSAGLVEDFNWYFAGDPIHTTGAYVSANFALVARLAPHILLELGPVITYRTEQGAEDHIDLNNLHTQLYMSARSSFRLDF